MDRSAPSPGESPHDGTQLTRWTLEFRDTELERQYRRDLRQETEHGIRAGLGLAALLFALFAVHDHLLLGDERFAVTLAMRAIIVTVTLAVLMFSYSPAFDRHREIALFGYIVFASVGLAAIVLAGSQEMADRYYAGFLLIAIAAYLLIGASLRTATLASLATFSIYLATEFISFVGFDLDAMIDASFLVSAMVIAAVSAYSFGKQRRLAYCRGLLLEQARVESRHSALHDPLTGLPNRRLLMERLAHALVRDERFHTFAAVLFIDVDAFKAVNDEYGHAFGDELLKAVGQRLLECIRATDTVARLGGDEFVVLLEDLAEAEAAAQFIGRMPERFETPFVIDGVTVSARLSVGCALHP